MVEQVDELVKARSWVRGKLYRSRVPVFVFRFIHPRREIEMNPQLIRRIMPGWECVWNTLDDGNTIFVCVQPRIGLSNPVETGNYEDYYMLSCVLSACEPQGDAFATGIVGPSAAAVIITWVKPYSSERGVPQPTGQLVHLIDLDTGERLVIYPGEIEMMFHHELVSREAAKNTYYAGLLEYTKPLSKIIRKLYEIATDIDTLYWTMQQPPTPQDVEEYLEELFMESVAEREEYTRKLRLVQKLEKLIPSYIEAWKKIVMERLPS